LDHSAFVLDYTQNPSNYTNKVQASYGGTSQIRQKISELFGKDVGQELTSYQDFIRKHFSNENQKSKLEISYTNGDT